MMLGLFKADLIVLFKRKLYWVMLIILLLMIGMTAVMLIWFIPRQMSGLGMNTLVEKPNVYAFGAAQVVSQSWFPLIMAVVVLSGEMATSIWASQLTRESRRWRHLISKLTLTTLACWFAFLLGIAVFAAIAYFLADGEGSIPLREWWDYAWKALPVVFIWTSLGFGAAGAFRSVGPAIGAVIGFTFLEQILSLWRPWQAISVSWASQALFGDFSAATSGMGFTMGSMSFSHALMVCLGWAVFGGLLSWVGVTVRDP